MTSVSSVVPTMRVVERPSLGVAQGLWPAGLTWFAFRTWVALAIGLYAAFFLELDGASSVGVCILIVAQPAQGQVLSKAIYRLTGTIVGVVVAVGLTALFPQDRTMLVASFAVFMGLQTALGSVLRDFRSYGCILAGYTVAIISVANIDTPELTFDSTVNRVAAILIGIVAIALTNSVLATAESSKSLIRKLREATHDIVGLASTTLDERRRPAPSLCVDTAARLMPLRGQISYATPEQAHGRARAAGARSALLGLMEMLSAVQAVGAGLAHVGGASEIVDRGVEIARKALRLQAPKRCAVELEALALPAIASGRLTIDEAYVLDRLHFMIETMSNVRDGLRAVRIGRWPCRTVALPVHQDWPAVVINAMRVATAVAIVAFLCVWSGLPATAQAVLFTAVFVSLGSVLPDPNIMGKTALLGMPAVVIVGAVYVFLVFPLITGFPLFIIVLAPLVLVMCWFIMRGMPGAGLIFGVNTLVLIAPANLQTLDPPTFVSNATMLTVSAVSIFLTFLLILPVDRNQRRLRIVLAGGRSLRRALVDKDRRAQPRASLHYDRLAQYQTWQGDGAPTLARAKTMMRLVDIGNLATAVRRSWRGLDRARAGVDPALDARARKALRRLALEEISDVSRAYLAAAASREGRSALDLVHAAAALHGTALATSTELRLLKRVDLLNRVI